MRLAYVSPFPPLVSGISDYSAELVPLLLERGHRRGVEVELFWEDGSEPPAFGVPAASWRSLPARHKAMPFDAVVYQLGNNSLFHSGAFRLLFEIPGIVMFHEVVIHHMIRELTLAKGHVDEYLEEVRYGAGWSGHTFARRGIDTAALIDPFRYPLFERVLDASLGAMVHSHGGRARLLASRPLAQVHRVPFPWTPSLDPLHCAPEAPSTRAALSTRLGVEPDAFVVACFGYLTRTKRLDVALRAFSQLARNEPRAVFLAVGEISKSEYDFTALVPPDLAPRVRALGRIDLEGFEAAMARTDVAINLRYPTGGETSATLMRLLGLGRAVLVTDGGAFAELPDEAVGKVPADETEEPVLAAYLARLANDEPLRRALGNNARRFVEREHRVEHTADCYLEAIAEIVRTGHVVRALPPLAPYSAGDVASETISQVTADMVDLGADERDEDLLSAVADEVRALGWFSRPL